MLAELDARRRRTNGAGLGEQVLESVALHEANTAYSNASDATGESFTPDEQSRLGKLP